MSERRWNPVFGEWVVMASATSNRPWQGKVNAAELEVLPQHDPHCYLCPEVERASGDKNPAYQGTWAFDNDFASFTANGELSDALQANDDPCVMRGNTSGKCRVLCWSPRHDMTLARLPSHEMPSVVKLWAREYHTLSAMPEVDYVMIFENKGKEVGVSNAHPHGQVYAMSYLPGKVERIRAAMQDWRSAYQRTVMADLLDHPEWQALWIDENEHFVHCVPWAARFPYESWIIPKREVANVADMSDDEHQALADLFHKAVIRYDNLFQRDCPNITIHYNSPSDLEGDSEGAWHYFCCFQPPLRDAQTLKYLAGFESGGNDIVNPVDPVMAAEQLRSQPLQHFAELS